MSNSHPQPPGGPPPSSSYNSGQQPFYRRSSYASIVSGAATASNSHPSQAGTRPASQYTSTPHLPPPLPSGGSSNLSRSSGWLDMDGLGGPGNGLHAPWSRGPVMANSSGPFGHHTSAPEAPKMEPFFVPQHLEGSRYAEQLREAYEAKLAAQRDLRTPYSSTSGSLTTSSSSANLLKTVPSHRGMTHDIIERAPLPTFLEVSPPPLPSKWNEGDKFPGLEITNNGMEVKFTGMAKASDEAAAVRADYPMPRACGIYYYEATILSRGKEGLFSIGFIGAKVTLNRFPGWEPDSWAYHGDDGMIYTGSQTGKPYGPKFGQQDVVGCGINFRTGTSFFTKNGVNLGPAFRDVKLDKLYPSVGMKKPHEALRVNFGQTPFVFDIESMFSNEKRLVMEDIKKANVANLYPPLTEGQLIHKLIAQYLAHDGYVETARAFSAEVRAENDALSGVASSPDALGQEEDRDAVNRQKIRLAILDGDIDSALKYTKAYYPTVLRDNENIYFKLRCRKFIEMIRKGSSMQDESERRRGKKPQAANGKSGLHDDYTDVFDHQMELDEQLGAGVSPRLGTQNGSGTIANDFGAMDTSEDPIEEEVFDRHKSLNETIQYGQELSGEFSNDSRREVKRELENTLALIAYDNPKESSLKELLEEKGRVPIAEELNGAILVSLGKSASAALERMVQQTEVMLQELGDTGGPGAFVHLRTDFLEPR